MTMYQESFRKNVNIEEIAPKLFVYRNFIKGDLLQKINKILEQQTQGPISDHNTDWYNSRFTYIVPEIHDVWEQASDLIYPDLQMHPQLCFLRSKVGEPGMFPHSDAPGKPHEDCGPECATCDVAAASLISSDAWNTCCRLHYGLIVYFGDFEGGEVYYPNFNKKAEYIGGFEPFQNKEELCVKPENGDLIIHGAHSDYCHGVKEVTSGIRFAFSNFVIPSHTNPGTFYGYKTREYNEQIQKIKSNTNNTVNAWSSWCQTVNNYVWQPPEKVLEERKNGITHIRYRD